MGLKGFGRNFKNFFDFPKSRLSHEKIPNKGKNIASGFNNPASNLEILGKKKVGLLHPTLIKF